MARWGLKRIRRCLSDLICSSRWYERSVRMRSCDKIRAMRKLCGLLSVVVALVASRPNLLAIGQTRYVDAAASRGSFAIVGPRGACAIYVDATDWPGVIRAANDLQADIQRVTGAVPVLSHDAVYARTD